MSAGATGWLEKKSGGKDSKAKSKVLEKWDRRWFVLPAGATELSYYKSDKAGAAAAGSIDCAGAHVFLKEVKGQTFRFTVRASTRELKLRAPTAATRRTSSTIRSASPPPPRREAAANGLLQQGRAPIASTATLLKP